MRRCFEKSASCVEGYQGARGESQLASLSSGQRFYVGTNEGQVIAYDCWPEDLASIRCSSVETLRKQAKDRKAITSVVVVDAWNVLLTIVDGVVVAYDLRTMQLVSQLADTKGCSMFAAHARSNFLVVSNKKKLSFYLWEQQQMSFGFAREVVVQEAPKKLICVSSAIVVGYRKHYELLDLGTFVSMRLLDFDTEHKMVGVELPCLASRPEGTLLSIGFQAVAVNTGPSRVAPTRGAGRAGSSSSSSSNREGDRIEWTELPLAMDVLVPFIVTLHQESVVVHDLVCLGAPLQRISMGCPVSSFCSFFSSNSGPTSTMMMMMKDSLLVASADKLFFLKMVSIARQVSMLSDDGQYEEAVSLFTACKSFVDTRTTGSSQDIFPRADEGLNIASVYEKLALSLFQKGDFEGSLASFTSADTSFKQVVSLFPDFVPTVLQAFCGVGTSLLPSTRTDVKLGGIILHRAAAAVVQFCEFHRPKISSQADRAEKVRSAGISGVIGAVASSLGSFPSSSRAASSGGGGGDEDYNLDPDEAIRLAELLDTVLISALVSCSPPRRAAVVEILSNHNNRCHIDSSSVLLASQGNSFTEALLWLYRSHKEHRRVLTALVEDRCVGVGAWTREQFYTWTADYLRWLWYNDDPLLPQLTLSALRPVLEFDAKLGMSVLTSKPKGRSTFGGKGVTVQEVISFLESVQPAPVSAFSSALAPSSSSSSSSRRSSQQQLNCHGGDVSIPLLNGRALGVAYLEWLVSSGAAPASMHDEFVQLLMEGVPLDKDLDHAANDLELRPGDSESLLLYKIYRRKLQSFLHSSTEYHPDRILKFLPQQFLHEYALLISRMERHEEVLNIYFHQLDDLELAEAYCDQVFKKIEEEKHTSSGTRWDEQNIYLCLVKTILGPTTCSSSSQDDFQKERGEAERSFLAIGLAEKYYDKMDPSVVLGLLPPSVPVAALSRYLSIVLEHCNAKKRNLGVIKNCMRTREVDLKTI